MSDGFSIPQCNDTKSACKIESRNELKDRNIIAFLTRRLPGYWLIASSQMMDGCRPGVFVTCHRGSSGKRQRGVWSSVWYNWGETNRSRQTARPLEFMNSLVSVLLGWRQGRLLLRWCWKPIWKRETFFPLSFNSWVLRSGFWIINLYKTSRSNLSLGYVQQLQ